MDKSPSPRLWSDFDGTAVEIVPRTNPRNWLKYPLSGITGYADFLRGVQSGGVEIAGIVSRRPDIWPRRFVTARSVAKIGLSEFFGEQGRVVLLGNEDRKGLFIAIESRRVPTAIIDDKPHKIGACLLAGLVTGSVDDEFHHAVIGVVDHVKTAEYMERLAKKAEAFCTQNGSTEVLEINGNIRVNGQAFGLDVVRVEPYCHEAGVTFAKQLQAIFAG